MHPICHWLWALPQIPQEIRSPFYRPLRMWGNRKSLHYATRCPFTLSYHHKEPSPQFIVHWWKSALSSKLSRRNIDHLITFLATNEDLIKSQNTTSSHTPQPRNRYVQRFTSRNQKFGEYPVEQQSTLA
ncbi:hypothetical protein AVEN_27270-1 [Araneus ventricosus]|uniref:Uncharacterized protein n=1 Tax=Araneus ventricosus TaxID=182803 RepID=A0A4Y2UED4_ARAVE|nr:hypothetical protein AVEN_250117-1 [Araneus ventricosus]GBO09976.1 hypothetical protein AVEN_27270-1 [Araneus ventricosus]